MTDAADAPAILDQVLETVPAELRFVVARRDFATAEAMSLREGQVLTFAQEIPPPVTLVAGDVVLATGELVDVEGERGVRVVALAEPMP